MAATLSLAYMLNWIDRLILALLLDPVKHDLGLTDVQAGLLIGVAFAAFYVTLAVPFARLADRYNRVWLITAGIALWSLMTALGSLAQSYAWLFVTRLGVGIGEAALVPATYSLLADYFDRARMARAMSVFNVGGEAGAGLAFVISGLVVWTMGSAVALHVPALGELAPWRVAFLAVGLPGIAVAMVVLLTVRDPRHVSRKQTSRDVKRGSAWEVATFVWLQRKPLAALFVGQGLLMVTVYAYNAWVPTMMGRVFGWSTAQTGMIVGLSTAVCAATAALLGGWFGDRLYAAGRRDVATTLLAAMYLVAVVPTALAPLAPNGALVLALWGTGILLYATGGAPVAAALQMITPVHLRATVSALYLLTVSTLGLTLGPTSVGLLNDQVFESELMVNHSLAIVAGTTLPLAALCLWAGRRGLVARLRETEAGSSGARIQSPPEHIDSRLSIDGGHSS